MRRGTCFACGIGVLDLEVLLPQLACHVVHAAQLLDFAMGDGIDASLENEPGILFDAIAVAGGAGARALAADVRALEHVRDAYRHGKPLLFAGEAGTVLAAAGIGGNGEPPAGVFLVESAGGDALDAFAQAIGGPRFAEREPALVVG